jgi:hypothetical protein
MPKVIVRKCPFTGKIFEDEVKYRKHLNQVRATNRTRWVLDRADCNDDAWWALVRGQERSLEDFAAWIIQEQDRFWKDAAKADPREFEQVGKPVGRKTRVLPMPVLAKFTEFNFRWSDSVANTHSAPRGRVENWHRRPGLPMGYPGWHGRVEWAIKWPDEFDGWYPGSRLFNGTRCGVHTGTGGFVELRNGLQRFGYDAVIWADDWPGLARCYEKQLMWNQLQEK